MNHLTLRINANTEYIYNVVKEVDLENHIEYNKVWRFGGVLYVDGKRVYDGCIKSEYLGKYDEIATDFFKNNSVNINIPTIPYR